MNVAELERDRYIDWDTFADAQCRQGPQRLNLSAAQQSFIVCSGISSRYRTSE